MQTQGFARLPWVTQLQCKGQNSGQLVHTAFITTDEFADVLAEELQLQRVGTLHRCRQRPPQGTISAQCDFLCPHYQQPKAPAEQPQRQPRGRPADNSAKPRAQLQGGPQGCGCGWYITTRSYTDQPDMVEVVQRCGQHNAACLQRREERPMAPYRSTAGLQRLEQVVESMPGATYQQTALEHDRLYIEEFIAANPHLNLNTPAEARRPSRTAYLRP